jgi:hypothetical protein
VNVGCNLLTALIFKIYFYFLSFKNQLNMKSIQDAFHIDGVNFSDLPQEQKDIIENAAERLKDWQSVILSFDEELAINLITKQPNYHLLIQSDFPEDLSDKMVYAYMQAKESLKSNSR